MDPHFINQEKSTMLESVSKISACLRWGFSSSPGSSAERKRLQQSFEASNELHMVDFVPEETAPEEKRVLRHTFRKYYDTLTWL